MPTYQQQAVAYVRRWFKQKDRRPFPFQEQTWQAFLDGDHGLVHAPTGTGKTLAVFLGAAIEWLATHKEAFNELKDFQKENQYQEVAGLVEVVTASTTPQKATSIDKLNREKPKRRRAKPLDKNRRIQVLWVTPLRALASDTTASLAAAVDELGLPWLVEKRTGDTDARTRNRQRKRYPEVLVTTPESLTLMLSWPETLDRFDELKLVVVDEWHELMGSKRGVQTELALARLRATQPQLRQWGMSATIGNLDEALATLTGANPQRPARLIRGSMQKKLEIRSLIPESIERFPWSGHLGTRLAPQVAAAVNAARTSLVFTNTRSQTEFWYRALLNADPGLAGQIAVHHGSLDRGLRDWVEASLREGSLKCCVCTSSLDLGVDFSVVDHVFQVGSPKGNARLLQRAGRSGHQPGVASRVTFVPTNALELIELAAVRDAIEANQIEARIPVRNPLDVLAQHVVTVALAGGFDPEELLAEVRTTTAYATLSDAEWQWVLDFAERGGASLGAYPDFHRIQMEGGRYVVKDDRIARLHRLSIGTIVGDAAIKVKYLRGGSLGTVEESFIGKMETGDRFLLGGKLLELVRFRDNVAYVRKGKGKTTTIPRWMGGRMPLSSEVSAALRQKLTEARSGVFDSPELRAVKPLLEVQAAWSVLPGSNQLLIERLKDRGGHHLFVYPFDGRLVHEGMAALLAWRLSQLQPISFSMAMNDYGFALTSPSEADLERGIAAGLFSAATIAEDIFQSLNASEMSKRQFREIARIAGLIFEGYPGQRKAARHLQASSNLFFDVFQEYDPDNLLLHQAHKEVLQRQLQQSRLAAALQRIADCEIVINEIARPTPLAFPLIADGLRDRLSSEKLSDRLKRMQESLENHARETMQD